MLQQVKTVPISLELPAPMFKRLEERAREKNYRPAVYIKMLIEAAYAARCADERGDEPVDAELDHQVRQVFLLADCEAEFIAETLHIPRERVEQILAGWKLAAKNGLARPQNAPAPEPAAAPALAAAGDVADESPPAPYRDPRSLKAWPDATILLASTMWGDGKSAAEIGAAIGKTGGAVSVFVCKNRHLFPYREDTGSPPATSEASELKGGEENQ